MLRPAAQALLRRSDEREASRGCNLRAALDVGTGPARGGPAASSAGDRQPSGRRHGFTLAIDVKLFSATVASVQQCGGSGGASQTISVGDRIWGVAPMLVLGYDSK